MKKLLVGLTVLLSVATASASVNNWTIIASQDDFSGKLQSFDLVTVAKDGSFRPSKLQISVKCGKPASVLFFNGDPLQTGKIKIKASNGKLLSHSHKKNNWDIGGSTVRFNGSLSKKLVNDMLKSENIKVQGKTRKGLKTVSFNLGMFKPLFNLMNAKCK